MSGDEKADGPRNHPWARFLIDKAVGAVVAGLAAAFVVGFQYHTIKTDVAGAVTTANQAHGLAVASQRAFRKHKDEVKAEVASIKAGIKDQTIVLRGTFSKQYGLLKDMMAASTADFGRFSSRIDEAFKWMREQQSRDSVRMREEWRDWQQRNSK